MKMTLQQLIDELNRIRRDELHDIPADRVYVYSIAHHDKPCRDKQYTCFDVSHFETDDIADSDDEPLQYAIQINLMRDAKTSQ